MSVPKSILSPEMAIRNAWARTLSLSSNATLQSNKDVINPKDQLQKILENAQTYEEIRYINEVISAIESTFRNLATARNHFNLNLAELDKRRQKRIQDLDTTTTVSSDFQSLISRISAITFGGTGGLTAWGFLVNTTQGLFPKLNNVDTIFLPLFLATGASIGYIVHNFWYIPRKAEKIQKQLIRTDYDQIKYFELYIKRVKSALTELYEQTIRLYHDIFSSEYPTTRTAEVCVTSILKSLEMNDFYCSKMDEHINNENLNADTWVICETDKDGKGCKLKQHKKGNPITRFFKQLHNRNKPIPPPPKTPT
jgi:hypothetical protein